MIKCVGNGRLKYIKFEEKLNFHSVQPADLLQKTERVSTNLY